MTCDDLMQVSRAEALFNSIVSTSETPGRPELDIIIADTVRRLGGVRRCAAEMAAAYGERPETAAVRMRWALRLVTAAYPPGSDR